MNSRRPRPQRPFADYTITLDTEKMTAGGRCLARADGKVYFCPDTRHKKEFLLGSHYPDPENILKIWGNERHKKMVFGNSPGLCKTRCTFAPYNRQCENLFTGNDPMCWRFI